MFLSLQDRNSTYNHLSIGTIGMIKNSNIASTQYVNIDFLVHHLSFESKYEIIFIIFLKSTELLWMTHRSNAAIQIFSHYHSKLRTLIYLRCVEVPGLLTKIKHNFV